MQGQSKWRAENPSSSLSLTILEPSYKDITKKKTSFQYQILFTTFSCFLCGVGPPFLFPNFQDLSLKRQRLFLSSQSEVCCPDGQVLPSYAPGASDAQCCAMASYNDKTHMCCNNNITPRLGGNQSECCGNEAYNRIQEVCCSPGHIVPRYAPGGTDAKCCAMASFNERTHICCNDTVTIRVGGDRAGCCGDISYNTFTQVCRHWANPNPSFQRTLTLTQT